MENRCVRTCLCQILRTRRQPWTSARSMVASRQVGGDWTTIPQPNRRPTPPRLAHFQIEVGWGARALPLATIFSNLVSKRWRGPCDILPLRFQRGWPFLPLSQLGSGAACSPAVGLLSPPRTVIDDRPRTVLPPASTFPPGCVPPHVVSALHVGNVQLLVLPLAACSAKSDNEPLQHLVRLLLFLVAAVVAAGAAAAALVDGAAAPVADAASLHRAALVPASRRRAGGIASVLPGAVLVPVVFPLPGANASPPTLKASLRDHGTSPSLPPRPAHTALRTPWHEPKKIPQGCTAAPRKFEGDPVQPAPRLPGAAP
mmetsp:Transcript_94276/g.196792  ORF Transcript_94276/g.196792 Transcript_94276/m.196792 type:complete len:314 (-) Transcript_94276:1844-2785(-)